MISLTFVSLLTETSDAGATARGRAAAQDARPQPGDAAADGGAVCRERAFDKRDCHSQRNN